MTGSHTSLLLILVLSLVLVAWYPCTNHGISVSATIYFLKHRDTSVGEKAVRTHPSLCFMPFTIQAGCIFVSP